jgi:hypothetical protein
MAQQLKKFLNNFLHQDNWRTYLLDQWPKVVGNLHTKVHIQQITKNNTLVLEVIDSCWLQELYLLSETLLKTINNALEKPHIKKLHFRLIGKTKKNIRVHKNNKQPVFDAVTLHHREEHALKSIDDEELKNLLRLFCIRCHKERKR